MKKLPGPDEPFTPEDLLLTRMRMKMNQTDFGAILGYRFPQVRISELERGVSPIPLRVRRICEEIHRKLSERWK